MTCRGCAGDGCAVCHGGGEEPDPTIQEWRARVLVAMLRAVAERGLRDARAEALEAEADAIAAVERLHEARDRLNEWAGMAEEAIRYGDKLPP